MHKRTPRITKLIAKAALKARKKTSDGPDPTVVTSVKWPVNCTVGPGLEGAIACASKVGYVNGSQGRLSYRGYDIFDLCAGSTFEETSYLLLKGSLPSKLQLQAFKAKLNAYRHIPDSLRHLMGFPVERMSTMEALRLGTTLMRHSLANSSFKASSTDVVGAISSDEDSIAMETAPRGEEHAIYEFKSKTPSGKVFDSCCRLIAGLSSTAAAIGRIRSGQLPIDPDPQLGHAANFLYMLTGKKPTAEQERVMDVTLILHADHGINASTFAALVVASTLSDICSSVISGIGALTGPLHGGANEQVLSMLRQIGSAQNAKEWCAETLANKQKIMGVGHRVYKTRDPRACILAPLAKHLARQDKNTSQLLEIATALEKEVVKTLGKKGLFPNVDFYSGMVYNALGISETLFTPIFAVSRVTGWTARIIEYLQDNRIFRPRVMYNGARGRKYIPISERPATKRQAAKNK